MAGLREISITPHHSETLEQWSPLSELIQLHLQGNHVPPLVFGQDTHVVTSLMCTIEASIYIEAGSIVTSQRPSEIVADFYYCTVAHLHEKLSVLL